MTMLAFALAAATVSAELDLRGVFPPEIKTVGVAMPGAANKGERGKRKLSPADLKVARAKVEDLKREFAARAGCPVYDGYAYGHVAVSHTIDFRRPVSVAEDGTMTWLAGE